MIPSPPATSPRPVSQAERTASSIPSRREPTMASAVRTPRSAAASGPVRLAPSDTILAGSPGIARSPAWLPDTRRARNGEALPRLTPTPAAPVHAFDLLHLSAAWNILPVETSPFTAFPNYRRSAHPFRSHVQPIKPVLKTS